MVLLPYNVLPAKHYPAPSHAGRHRPSTSHPHSTLPDQQARRCPAVLPYASPARKRLQLNHSRSGKQVALPYQVPSRVERYQARLFRRVSLLRNQAPNHSTRASQIEGMVRLIHNVMNIMTKFTVVPKKYMLICGLVKHSQYSTLHTSSTLLG